MTNPTDKALVGKRVLVTRPEHQTDRFVAMLQRFGAIPHCLPSIAIELADDLSDPQTDSTLNADMLIFTSSNAVTGLLRLRPATMFNYSNTKIAAIGRATAKALSDHSIQVDVLPAQAKGSEQLLKILCIEKIRQQRITIIRGDGGREKLRDVLIQAGAIVQYLQVYRRTLPLISAATARQIFTDAAPDIISITSDLGLDHLCRLLPADTHRQLFKTALVVNSLRCADFARTSGFTADVYVADPPGDEGQLQALIQRFR